ncbi:MAG: response regulator [SAR324 cluster bacterium]|nr:response regulator [SAR324 cluster bacterium]
MLFKESKKPLIMLAEPFQKGRKGLADQIDSAEFDLCFIPDILDIFSFIETTVPDLILLDSRNAKVSGVDILNFLQSHPVYRRIPVIMLLNLAGKKDLPEFLEKGATDYLIKPFDAIELRTRIKIALRLGRQVSAQTKDNQELEKNLTEKNQKEEQLRLSQKLKAIGTLAGGIAHDMNKSLSAIQGCLSSAREKLSPGNSICDDLTKASEGVKKAENLIERILIFSRQRHGKRVPLSVVPMLKESLSVIRLSLPANVELRLEINGSGQWILADPSQLHEVLANLCANAIEAMRQEGGILQVTLEEIHCDQPLALLYEVKEGNYLKLTVRDTGCGMDSALKERIFDPFFTTKSVDQGTGIGLSAVYGIVKSHEGAIAVSSETGSGTRVSLILPTIKHWKSSSDLRSEDGPVEKINWSSEFT